MTREGQFFSKYFRKIVKNYFIWFKERTSCTAFHKAHTQLLCPLQKRSWTTGWDCCSRAQETVWTTTLRSSVNLMSAERWEAKFIICLWSLNTTTENIWRQIFHIMCWLLCSFFSRPWQHPPQLCIIMKRALHNSLLHCSYRHHLLMAQFILIRKAE